MSWTIGRTGGLGLILLTSLTCSGRDGPTSGPGAYMGFDPPGSIPKVFAPGLVSTEAIELNAAFSPDGREFYFTERRGGRNTLMGMRRSEDRWTERSVVSFSGNHSDVDPFISADGRTLYFSSSRPLVGGGEAKDSDLWFAARAPNGGWNDPIHLKAVNEQGLDDYYTSVSDDGFLYLSRFQSHGSGGDLYRSKMVNGDFGVAERLEAPLSTPASEHDPFIAPDGGFLIFTSDRDGGYGESDLYVSFPTSDGGWSEPRNMGPDVNSPGYDYCPMLSPDGQYLFFTRNQGGDGDIYWVDASVIDGLRPNVF